MAVERIFSGIRLDPTLRLCLASEKYKGKKNVKENSFLIFNFTINFFKEN